MAGKRSRRADDAEDAGKESKPKKARLESPSYAFAWGNKKFSDAQIKIFEEGDALPKRRSSRRSSAKDVKGLDEDSDACEVLYVSKLALGGYSDFFQRMFDVGMVEDNQSIVELRVKKGQREACKDAIRHVYFGDFQNRSHEHLLNVVSLAHRFDLIHVAKFACEALIELVPLKEYGDSSDDDEKSEKEKEKLKASADKMRGEIYEALLSMPEQLRQAAWFTPIFDAIQRNLRLWLPNLKKIWANDSYRSLGGRSLALVLSNNRLDVNTEEDCFKVFCEWLLADTDDGSVDEAAVRVVIDAIRFPVMHRRYLRLFVRRCECPEKERLLERVEEALDFQALEKSKRDEFLSDVPERERTLFVNRGEVSKRDISIPIDVDFDGFRSERIEMVDDQDCEHFFDTLFDLKHGVSFKIFLTLYESKMTKCWVRVEVPSGQKTWIERKNGSKLYGTIVLRGTFELDNNEECLFDVTKSFLVLICEGVRNFDTPKIEFERPENFDVTEFSVEGVLQF